MAKQVFLRSAFGSPFIVMGLIILTLISPHFAFAQATAPAAEPEGRVLLAPLFQTAIPYVAELFMAGLFALLALIAAWVKKKWNIDMEAKLKDIEANHRTALHSAIMTAVRNAAAKGEDLSINVRSESLASIIRYLRDSVPDALKFFKPSDAVIAKLATAHALELAAAQPPAANAYGSPDIPDQRR